MISFVSNSIGSGNGLALNGDKSHLEAILTWAGIAKNKRLCANPFIETTMLID